VKTDIERIRWIGNQRTRNHLIKSLLEQPHVTNKDDVRTIGQLIPYQSEIQRTLLASGLFKKVVVNSQAYGETEHEAAYGDKSEILVEVEEKNLFTGQVGVSTDVNRSCQGETKLEFSVNNFLGNGEKVSLEGNSDAFNRSNESTPFANVIPDAWKLSYKKPIISTREKQHAVSSLELNVEDKVSEYGWLLSKERGSSVGFALGLTPWQHGRFTHSLLGQMVVRSLSGQPGQAVPLDLRKAFKDSQKTSLTYHADINHLQDGESGTPVEGYRVHANTELACFGLGSSEFIKISGGLQKYLSFGNLTTQLTSRFGYIAGKPEVQDKLYLGGPLDIRGYKINEACPKTGGLLQAALGLHAYYPIGKGLNIHAFGNAGAVGNTPHGLAGNIKHSAGVGLCFPLPILPGAVIQLNYVVKPDPKLQFGIGLETL